MMLAMASTLGVMLATRALLMLALIGAFALALLTVTDPTTNRLIANAIFDVLVFLPLTALYAARG